MSNLIFYTIGFFTGAGLVGAVQRIRDLRAYYRAQVQAQLGAKLAERHINREYCGEWVETTTVYAPEGVNGQQFPVLTDNSPVDWPETLDLSGGR